MLAPNEITFEPGVVAPGGVITLNVLRYPRIAQLFGGYIERLANHAAVDVLAGVGNHTAVATIGGLANHGNVQVGLANHLQLDIVVATIDHPQADVIVTALDHPVHAHDFVVTGIGGASAFNVGVNAGLNAIEDSGGVGAHTIVGAGVSGVQNLAVAQDHVPAAAIVHNPGIAVPHAAGAVVPHAAGAAVAHVAGVPLTHAATRVVATVLAQTSDRTFTTTVACIAGDKLHVSYWAVGEKMLAAAT